MLKQIIYIMGSCVVLFSCKHNSEEHTQTAAKKDTLAVTDNACEKHYAQAKASDAILMRAMVLDKTVATKAIADFNAYASTSSCSATDMYRYRSCPAYSLNSLSIAFA